MQLRQTERGRDARDGGPGRPLRELSSPRRWWTTRRARGWTARKVEVSVGLPEIDPDLLRLASAMVASGTALDGAQLQIVLAGGDELVVQALESARCVSPSPVA
jgi:hypothetical protein